jgi:methyl-accepting chemotaxis protein
LTWRTDTRGVTRFLPDPSQPRDLVASIVSLSDQTTKQAFDFAVEAARADSLGKVALVVEYVCRLAVTAGVAVGEIAWLVGELAHTSAAETELGRARVAVGSLHGSVQSVSFAVQDVAEAGGPDEIAASAEALDRVAAQLEGLLAGLQPV